MPNPLEASRVNRSQYLADALSALQTQGQQTRTAGALGANLIASYLLNRQRNRAEEEERRLAEEADKPRREAQARLLSAFGGGGQPAAPGQPQAVAMNAEGGGIVPTAPQAEASVPSLSDPAFMQTLIGAQLAGVEGVDDMVRALEAGRPDITIGPNGEALDTRDPDNIGRNFAPYEYIDGVRVNAQSPDAPSVIPQAVAGMIPIFDDSGNVVRLEPLPGYLGMQGSLAAAQSGGRMAGELPYVGPTAEAQAAGAGRGGAPYEPITVQGPDGQPITMSLQALLDGGGIMGQTREEASAADVEGRTTAEREAEIFRRAEAAPSAIRRYQGALELLPDAITGFGADVTLQGARGLAALGNEYAARRVAATELYQTLINRDLGILIREIAGSTQISNTDREFAARVSGGDIQMNPQTLTRLLQIYIEDQNRVIAQAEALRSGGGSRSGAPRRRRYNPATGQLE